MSQQGIRLVADLLTEMQRVRHLLIKMGSSQLKTQAGRTDMLLGQMVERMKDSENHNFIAITAGMHDAQRDDLPKGNEVPLPSELPDAVKAARA
jgi:hypothetical protein